MIQTIKAIAKKPPVVHERYILREFLKDPVFPTWYLEKTDTITSPVKGFQKISETEFAVLTEGALYIVDVQES